MPTLAALWTPRSSRCLPGIALLLALASLPVPAQNAPPVSGPYRIAGKVVNALTDEPVRRATVAVLAEEDSRTIATVQSDSDGHFSLENLPAAKYQLTASKRGFRTAFYDEHEEYSSAIVTGPDQDTEHLTFRLVPASSVHGAVTADGGDPVEGADVMLFLKPHGHNPGERIAQVGATITDDTGAYDFGNLAAGEYLLAVKAEPWYAVHNGGGARQRPGRDTSDPLDVAYPVTYFDSTSEEPAANTIVLSGGYREQANINLHAVPALHIAVDAPRPTDANMQPTLPSLAQSIFGAKVLTGSTVFSTDPQQTTVEFGGMAPGHYEVELGDPPRIVELDANSSQRIDPSLGTPTVTVKGTLRDASGAALPDALTLIINAHDSSQARQPVITTCNQGSFSIPVVLPGTWELWAFTPTKQLPIASIAVGSRAHAGNLLTVRDRPLNIAVTVSQSETRVEGFSRKDGKGFAGAMVVLVPPNPAINRDLFRRDQSDSDGSFALRDAAPGQYTVVAIEDGWTLDWSLPEVIDRYLPRGIAVTVTEQSGKHLHLSQPVPVQER